MGIRELTIKKYVGFFRELKENEGKTVDVHDMIKRHGVSTNVLSEMKGLGLLDYRRGHIKKVIFSKVEPKTARSFFDELKARQSKLAEKAFENAVERIDKKIDVITKELHLVLKIKVEIV